MAGHARVLGELLADLAAESGWLESVIDDLDDGGWGRPTPAAGWTVAHQIAHLAWTDETALLAVTDAAGFAALVARVFTGEVTVDGAAAQGVRQTPSVATQRWRSGRERLATALAAAPADARLPWFGPAMSPASMATARLMETWAHGQDVAEAVGVPHPVTSRLRHVADLGVRTRDFAFRLHGLTPPREEFAVRLLAPDGATWSWGPSAAGQRVNGSALDFCLLATRRRHRDDTDLIAAGADADRWLDLAQAFAGPASPGRAPTTAERRTATP